MRLIIDLPEDIYKKIVDRIVTVSDVDIICQAILDHEGEEKERPHGKWTYVCDEKAELFLNDKWYCSACGDYNTYGTPAFCPNCGADMRKEGDQE